jgi:hypothetical protein
LHCSNTFSAVCSQSIDLLLRQWRIAFPQSSKTVASLQEYKIMNTETFGTLQGKHIGQDALVRRRAIIINKARESVRLSHQRMRSRARKFRA